MQECYNNLDYPGSVRWQHCLSTRIYTWPLPIPYYIIGVPDNITSTIPLHKCQSRIEFK